MGSILALNSSAQGYSNFVKTQGFIDVLPPKTQDSDETVYLWEDWVKSDITLISGENITGYEILFDIENNIIEIDTKEGIKLLNGTKVKEFTAFSSELKSTTYLRDVFIADENELIEIRGFAKLLYLGKGFLLQERASVERLPPTYNASMDVGRKAEHIVLKKQFYFLEDEKLVEIKGKVKNNLSVFGDKKSQMKSHIKNHRLSFKNEKNLVKNFRYYDGLLVL